MNKQGKTIIRMELPVTGNSKNAPQYPALLPSLQSHGDIYGVRHCFSFGF